MGGKLLHTISQAPMSFAMRVMTYLLCLLSDSLSMSSCSRQWILHIPVEPMTLSAALICSPVILATTYAALSELAPKALLIQSPTA